MRVLPWILTLSLVFSLSACSSEDGSKAIKNTDNSKSKVSSETTDKTGAKKNTVSPVPSSAPAAPSGWVNSKDSRFRVKLPSDYLDAYEAAQGKSSPDAQVIMSLPSFMAVNDVVPLVAIDAAQAISDPKIVENTIRQDPRYQKLSDFKVLEAPHAKDISTLYVTYRYPYKDLEIQAHLCFVMGKGLAYAVKQDIIISDSQIVEPVVRPVVESWTWLI